MHKSASSPMLPANHEGERHEASLMLPASQVQRRRPRRSLSQEPPPLKDRLFTALTRFRYGWNFRSSVEIISEVPIWLLGHCYHSEEDRGSQDIEGAPPHIKAFMEHFNTLVWMTYRTHFPAINGTNIRTDCGWGCMVRSGQMILANALIIYLLGGQWRRSTSTLNQHIQHKQVLSWFADHPSPLCPFSLHALMKVAVRLGHRPGDWFGPSQLAILIRECVIESRKHHPSLCDLQVYVAHDCTVYCGDLVKLYGERSGQSLLLLVPVRLGSESLNPIYIPCVKALLALDHCVGIIGGKPRHSVYFVGFQDDKLVHLDPHYCQLAIEPAKDEQFTDFDTKTYHCSTPRKLSAAKMDPSCTIGFLCSSLQEFRTLRAQAEKVLAPPLQKGVYPFFSFSDLCMEEMLDKSLNIMNGEGDNGWMVGEEPRRKHRGRSVGEGVSMHEVEDFVVIDCVRTEKAVPDSVPGATSGGEGVAEAKGVAEVKEEGVAEVREEGVASGSTTSDDELFATALASGDQECEGERVKSKVLQAKEGVGFEMSEGVAEIAGLGLLESEHTCNSNPHFNS